MGSDEAVKQLPVHYCIQPQSSFPSHKGVCLQSRGIYIPTERFGDGEEIVGIWLCRHLQ